MSRENGKPRGAAARNGVKYRYVSSVVEDNSTEPIATFGIQFAWKPSKYHLQGGGSIWPGRGPLNRGGKVNLDPIGTPPPPSEPPKEDLILVDDDDDDDVIIVSETKNEGRWRDLFATCNGNSIRVYEARKQMKPTLLQIYEEEDAREQFYCVAWTYNVDGNHEWWICAAGLKGILRVINTNKGASKMALAGHGEAINDLKVHPTDSSLVITASKDESLRLWNLRTQSTVAVFAGLKGHRGEVVHLDFGPDGKRVVSCGIDNSVRIWEINDDDKVMEAILESHEAADVGVKDTYVYHDKTGTRRKTKVPVAQFPSFVTRKVHKHYVDCVMWVGDLLLSKSVHNRMFLWEPGNDRESLSTPASSYTLLEEYVLNVCNVWFIRFGMDRQRRLVACGNDKGIVTVFDLAMIPSKALCQVGPKDKFRYNQDFVRQCAFSEDGSILVSVDDTSSVVQYER